MRATSCIEVDLGAVGENARLVREALAPADPGAPRPRLCAVLKADAYGLGAPRVAKRLGVDGADMIAVYTPEQARELVDANIGVPIMLLMPVRELPRSDRLYLAATRGLLHLVVHDPADLNALCEVADGLGVRLPLHLEIDTGMARGGLEPRLASSLVARINEHPRLRLAGVCAHFACADTDAARTAEQSARFDAWLRDEAPGIGPDTLVHEANSFGVFRDSRYHRSMVRCGLALLGYLTEELRGPAESRLLRLAGALRPCVRWVSRVVHVKDLPAGTAVGYGSTWVARRRTRLALVPVGYADGYPLALSNGARVGVAIDGQPRALAPVVGRVSMDQITVDVTDLPADLVGVGTPIELVSPEPGAPNALPELARAAGTITHELLCRLSPRLPRRYVFSEAGAGVSGAREADAQGVAGG